jgi:hypothetical protein
MIDFTISEELKSIISKFGIRNNGVIELEFAEIYGKQTIYSIFRIRDLQKSFKAFENKVKDQVPDISHQHYNLLENAIYENLDSLKESRENNEGNERDQKTAYLRKYEHNGLLFESIVIEGIPKFACYDDGKLQALDKLEGPNHTFYPVDNISTNNPLPYLFDSEKEVERYMQLSRDETFDSLFDKVLKEYEKYVNADEHSTVTLAANTVGSHFQDKFGTTNYNILTGENGSGKNSALLVFRMLGYRVFYVTAASSANYYTFLGDIQEGQGTIAEDEADNIGYDIDKQRILKTGYASGGNVPKVEFNKNGVRSQSSYLTFCHKWLSMEELPHEKHIKGIIDRSFTHKFLIGEVQHNIKDVLKDKNSELYRQLIHLRKLLIAFKLTHYNDDFPLLRLNIRNRNRELTQPLLTLFRNGKNFDRIRLALSKLINEKSILKSNSIEAKIVEALYGLINAEENSNNLEQKIHEFSNDEIFYKLKEVMDGRDDQWGILGNAVYLPDGTKLTKAKVSSLLKSKFKAVSFRTNQKRGFRFNKLDLEKMSKQYEVVEEIVIDDITKEEGEENTSKVLANNKKNEKMVIEVTEVTEVTDFKGVCPVYYNDTNTDIGNNKTFETPKDEIGSETNKKANNDFINTGLKNNDNIECKSTHETNDLTANPDNDYFKNASKSINDNNKETMPISQIHPIDSVSEKNSINEDKDKVGVSINQNKTYTPSESVTTVTTVTSLPPKYPCYYCGNSYSTNIDLDMELHLHENHRDQMLKLPIKGNLDKREEYVISLTKKRMVENSLVDEEE